MKYFLLRSGHGVQQLRETLSGFLAGDPVPTAEIENEQGGNDFVFRVLPDPISDGQFVRGSLYRPEGPVQYGNIAFESKKELALYIRKRLEHEAQEIMQRAAQLARMSEANGKAIQEAIQFQASIPPE